MANPELPQNSGDQGGLPGFSREQLARYAQLRDMAILEQGDTSIPFTPAQIDIMVGLFSDNRYGKSLRRELDPKWKQRCQSYLFNCRNLAVASVDFRDPFIEDEPPGEEPAGFPARRLIVCKDHVPVAWAIFEKQILLERTKHDGYEPPSVGINGFTGKEIREMFPV